MQRFYKFCLRFLQISSLILFGILAVSSFLGTALIENPYEYVIRLRFDNPLLNLLFLCCFFGIFTSLSALFSRLKKGPSLLLVLTCLWVFGASLLWIYFSKNGPVADGSSVYYAARQFAADDFSAVAYRDSYFSVYPFQYGLAFFYEMIFRLVRNDNFHILQAVNSVCLVLCVISQYHLCGRFFRQKKAQIFTLLFTAFCSPFMMYSSFVYGEIPSITCMLFGTWMLLLFLEGTGQIPAPETETDSKKQAENLSPAVRALCGVLACLSIVCSVLIRKNSLIFIIALMITAALWLIHNKNKFSAKKLSLYAVYFVLLLTLSVSILPIVQNRYERRSGQTINPGVPSSTYLAMGLTETEVGPGFYSAYNFDTFTVDADYDTETAAKIGWEAYRERLSYFAGHPGYSLWFFCRKFCVEWIDTGWAVFPATYNSFGERRPLVESLFSGSLHEPFKNYINNYQMSLYLAAALCMFSLFRRKKDSDIFSYLFPLTAFGGALFFLAWEANGRYILPYAIFMLPYAGYGAHLLTDHFLNRIKKSASDRVA